MAAGLFSRVSGKRSRVLLFRERTCVAEAHYLGGDVIQRDSLIHGAEFDLRREFLTRMGVVLMHTVSRPMPCSVCAAARRAASLAPTPPVRCAGPRADDGSAARRRPSAARRRPSSKQQQTTRARPRGRAAAPRPRGRGGGGGPGGGAGGGGRGGAA